MRPDPHHPRPSPARLATLVAGLSLLVGTVLGACSNDGREMREPGPDQYPATTLREETTTAPSTEDGASGLLPGENVAGETDQTAETDENEGAPSGFVLAGPWPRGGPIDEIHTCLGDDVSPALRWFGAPEGASALAIVVTDPDAEGFIHWVIANLEPTTRVLGEGDVPVGALQATNDFGDLGWSGPCPPPGTSHRYTFELRALDQQIELPEGTPGAEMIAVLDAATFASTTYEGRFPES